MAAIDSQTAAVENEIAHLRGLDLDGLRARWIPLSEVPRLARVDLVDIGLRLRAAAG